MKSAVAPLACHTALGSACVGEGVELLPCSLSSWATSAAPGLHNVLRPVSPKEKAPCAALLQSPLTRTVDPLLTMRSERQPVATYGNGSRCKCLPSSSEHRALGPCPAVSTAA